MIFFNSILLLLAFCLFGSSQSQHADTYIGCFNDDSNRDLPHELLESSEMTIERCLVHCRNFGYGYAGLQYSKQCWCGDGYNDHGSAAENECVAACTGNIMQNCGGTWRNSIYELGTCHHVYTSSTEQANIYPWPAVPSGATTIHFKVRAQDNVHIGLATAKDDSTVLAEVVLGSDGGTRTMINRCKQCLQVAIENTPGVISANEDREFYISWAGNTVAVGTVGVGGAEIISHHFSKTINPSYIGIHTGWGHEGAWEYCY